MISAFSARPPARLKDGTVLIATRPLPVPLSAARSLFSAGRVEFVASVNSSLLVTFVPARGEN